jgi:hypothetical protein
VRRDGLSPEQLAALGGSSKVDDSEVRLSDSAGARADVGVKAKIDEIEQQMVGEQPREPVVRQRPAPRRAPVAPQHPTDFYTAPTEPAAFERHRPPPAMAPATAAAQPPAPGALDGMPSLPTLPDSHFPPAVLPRVPGVAPNAQPAAGVVSTWAPASKSAPRPTDRTDLLLPDLPVQPIGGAGCRAVTAASIRTAGLRSSQRGRARPRAGRGGDRLRQCRLRSMRASADKRCASRMRRAVAACRDLAGAVRPVPSHRPAAASSRAWRWSTRNQFGWSAPQWYSLPQLVADAAADDRGPTPAAPRATSAG